MFRNLSRHFGSITDTRVVTDPWGLEPPLKLEILRENHPEWVAWKNDNGFSGEEYQRDLLRAQVKTRVDQPGRTAGKRGVRARARAMDQVIDQVVDGMVTRIKAAAVDTSALEKLKEGLAAIAIKRVLSGLVEAEATCAACGKVFVPERGDAPCPGCKASEWTLGTERTIEDSIDARRRLLSNPVDREGLQLWVPATHVVQKSNERTGEIEEIEEDMPFGGQAVGDAIASWLMSEMEDQEAFRQRMVEAGTKNSEPALASSPASGKP